eukprot:CAMPEP_0204913512 /NCGR_PEP_ID=MMETSP1397-20131031/11347_1 /ASSEMBLY_ACC=CAM_ASM_000891 /TAXON_ID=49980 /ORGANISM="Climacostomum Climacostomum virens, Strain Stock W-24" /LENGTH=266 /DNA_ID=CAMNT_0052084751 /DNA_START=575 /DNA_END=1371 /DNA_ORIENTATION=-
MNIAPSRILQKKWEEDDHIRHLRNLSHSRPTVNSGARSSYKSKRSKSKKERLQEERYTEIERENRILLEKMISKPQPAVNLSRPPKSLNSVVRRREAEKIAKENAAIAKRLKERKPNYSFFKWEAERAEVESRIKNICEYPYKPGEGIPKSNSMRNRNYSERPRRLTPINKLLVFQKAMTVDGVLFDVSVYNDLKGVTISLENISKERFTLQLDYEVAMEFMKSSDDWGYLVSKLALEGDDVVLIENAKPRNASTAKNATPSVVSP